MATSRSDDDRAEPVGRLEEGPSFGRGASAIGSAMLGLEQALRSEPPPEVMAAEHVPVRGLSGADDVRVLVFPDEASLDQERPGGTLEP